MKQYGIFGKGSGKLGSSVFAISGGEQIVRQYNPVVSNPNTPAQVAQRAKLKLMSQLAADLAPVLAFAKDGLKSARNQFVSKNIGLADFRNDGASINYANLLITAGSAGFPGIEITIVNESVEVGTLEPVPADVDSVVFVVYKVADDGQLLLTDSEVVKVDNTEAPVSTILSFEGQQGVAYAYGIRSMATDAGVSYGDYNAEDATYIAELVATRKIKNAASSLTRNSGRGFVRV